MTDETIIKIKCPHCDKEWVVSPNAFDLADTVEIQCYDGIILLISFDKKTKKLIIKQS
ncbi:MAG: hypothetical protein LBC76_05515 [Treponema sp.]|jgi:hypothetical protein|nr:hypothetical protein [Treponema sp.]